MPPFGLIPWLFLIPALLIAAIGVFTLIFRRTSMGKARRKYILDKYEIVTGPERERERQEIERRKPAEMSEDEPTLIEPARDEGDSDEQG